MIPYYKEINETLFDFFIQNKGVILVTVISKIARSLYKGTSVCRLLIKTPISIIIGISMGILMQEFTDVSHNTIYVLCMLTGAYTGEILDGIEQLLKLIPSALKKIISKKLDIDDKDS